MDFEEYGEDAAPRRQLITYDQAKPTTKQHTKPCSDCPFSRKALPGWLGSDVGAPEIYMQMAGSETRFECHTRLGQQCAGAAIFRANICKTPRDATILRLQADRKTVFADRAEFLSHHREDKKGKKK